MILDGFGYNESDYGNAIRAAKMPNLDKIRETCPKTIIGASGLDVGLPDGQMGNSEVGHTNIGAGRIVYQPLMRITNAVRDGSFFKNEALCSAMENCKENVDGGLIGGASLKAPDFAAIVAAASK